MISKNGSLSEINIEYNNKLLSNPSNLKFLGIIIDNYLAWKNYVHMIAHKLSQACYIVRKTKPYLSHDDNFMMFFLIQLCLMDWFSLAMFVVNNKGLLMENSELYNITTRNNSNLYQPSSHLAIYHKGPYCIGIKVYNNFTVQIQMLPCNIRNLRQLLWIFYIHIPFILYLNTLTTIKINYVSSFNNWNIKSI